MVGAATLVATIVGILYATGAFVHHSSNGILKIVSGSYVTNGYERDFALQVNGGQLSQQKSASTPSVNVVVRNVGQGTVLIPRVSVTVVGYADLYPCVEQGGGDVSTSTPYAIQLPFFPSGRSSAFTIENLPKEVRPATNEHLTFRLTVPNAARTIFQLYAVHIVLTTAYPTGTLDAGRFLVSEPAALPIDDGGYFPVSDDVLRTRPFTSMRLQATWCFRRNVANVQRLLSMSHVIASPEVKSLAYVRPGPAWDRAQSHLSADTSAYRLLANLKRQVNSGDGEGALYAASITGDGRLQRTISRTAAEGLLTNARQGLQSEPTPSGNVVFEAREALSLFPSAQVQRFVHELARGDVSAARRG